MDYVQLSFVEHVSIWVFRDDVYPVYLPLPIDIEQLGTAGFAYGWFDEVSNRCYC